MEAVEQQFRRMAFNIVARNQDDHVKNIAFLMDKAGHWSLAPASPGAQPSRGRSPTPYQLFAEKESAFLRIPFSLDEMVGWSSVDEVVRDF